MADKKSNVEIYFKIDGLETYIDDLKTLENVLENVKDAQADVSKEQEQASKKTSLFRKSLKGIGKVGKVAFQGIGTALKATGLGIFLDLGARLVEWFNQTDVGSKLIQGSLAVVGEVFNRIGGYINDVIDLFKPLFEDPLGAIENFGNAIKDEIIGRIQSFIDGIGLLGEAVGKLFEGDFSGAFESATGAANKLFVEATGLDDAFNAVVAVGSAVVSEVTDIATAVGEAVVASNALVDAQNRLKERSAELIVENAQLEKSLEEQKKISEDTTRSYDERSAALDKVIEINEQLAANAVEQAKLEEDALIRQRDLAVTAAEKRDIDLQLAEATATRISAEKDASIVELESAQLRRELNQEEQDRIQALADLQAGLQLENITNRKEAADEALRIEEEAAIKEAQALRATKEELEAIREEYREKQKQSDAEFQTEIAEVLAGYAAEVQFTEEERLLKELQTQYEADRKRLVQAGATYAQLKALDEGYEQKKTEVTKKSEEERAAIRAQNLQMAIGIAGDFLNALQTLQDDSDTESVAQQKIAFENNKKFQIAQALISTFAAVAGQLAVPKDQLTGANFVKAGIALATGLAQVSKIKKTKFQAPTANEGDDVTPAISAASGGQNAFNVNQGIEQRDAEITEVGQFEQVPIKTYVIATDVTDAQQANKRIEDLAVL